MNAAGLISKRLQGFQLLLGLVEMLAATLLWFALKEIYTSKLALIDGNYKNYLLLILSAILADNALNSNDHLCEPAISIKREISLCLRRTAVVALFWFGYLAARQDLSVSRIYLFAYLLALPPTLIMFRKAAVFALSPIVFPSKHRFGAVLIGSPNESTEIVDWLASKNGIGVHLVGYLAPTAVAGPCPIPYLGPNDELNRVLSETRAGLVVSLSLPTDEAQALQLRVCCDRAGARLAFQCRLGNGFTSRVSLCQDDGFALLSLRTEPLQSPYNRMIKRIFDICVALPVVALILPPLAAMVWVMHRRNSPGPLFFRQQRGGLGGNPFLMLKFRTMHCGNPDEGKQAVAKDNRVFKGGHWLRKYSLDEFPQFLNVLGGSMSIVGPRPHLEVHDSAFAEISTEYRVRSMVKPGITGLAQVEGHRGPTPEVHHITSRVDADVRYVENWSFLSDLVLVMRTVTSFTHPTNAV